MIDNNQLNDPQAYQGALRIAWDAGTHEEPISPALVLDILEAWHGCRAYRRSYVRCGTIDVPDWTAVPQQMNALYGGVSFSFSEGETVLVGEAEEQFYKKDLPSFLAWMWMEHVAIQPLLDGNKRGAVLVLFYWLGREWVRSGVQYTFNAHIPFKRIMEARDPYRVLACWFGEVLEPVH